MRTWTAALVLAASAPAFAQGPLPVELKLAPGPTSVGSTITVELVIAQPRILIGMQLDLGFDPSVLTPLSSPWTPGESWTGSLMTVDNGLVDGADNLIRYTSIDLAEAALSDPRPAGVLMRASFTVTGSGSFTFQFATDGIYRFPILLDEMGDLVPVATTLLTFPSGAAVPLPYIESMPVPAPAIAGQVVPVTAKVKNPGSSAASVTVEFQADWSSTIATVSQSIPAGTTATISSPWDTAGMPTSHHIISASVSNADGVLAMDDYSLQLKLGMTTILPARAVTGEALIPITARVPNSSGASLVEETVEFRDGENLLESLTADLAMGQTVDVTAELPLGATAFGRRTITTTILGNGETSSATIDIIGVEVGAPNSVPPGSIATLTADIELDGTIPTLAGLVVEFRVGGDVVATATGDALGGEITRFEAGWNTDGVDQGSHVVTVTIEGAYGVSGSSATMSIGAAGAGGGGGKKCSAGASRGVLAWTILVAGLVLARRGT